MAFSSMDLHHVQSYFNVDFETAEREMLEYICPPVEQRILMKLVRLGASALFIKLSLQETFSEIYRIIFLLIGLFLGLSVFLTFSEHREIMKYLKRRNIYNDAVSDFHMAKSFMHDGVRLGNKFVYSVNSR